MPPDSPSNFIPVRTLSHAWRVVFMYAHTPFRDKDSPIFVPTPLYYGQFPMSRQNSHIFSLEKKNPL